MKPRNPVKVGEVFGKLTAVQYVPGSRAVLSRWICVCSCGNRTSAYGRDLRSGNTSSCGCASSRHSIGQRSQTHGMRKTKIYGVWCAMMRRCYNSKVRGFKDYGGRGIIVEERWHSFENFFADMGVPKSGMTLERKNTNGNYGPDNCIWASRLVQANNRRNVHLLSHDGKTLPISEWAKLLGIYRGTLYWRFRNGWPESRIFTPVSS